MIDYLQSWINMVGQVWRRIEFWLFTQSVKRRGIFVPIIVTRSGFVLDGRHRVDAARNLGLKVPAVVIDAEIELVDPWLLKTTLEDGGLR